MELKKVAESIIRDLNNLDARTKTVQKIAFSYPEKQIEIVLNHLRDLIVVDKPGEISKEHYVLGINEDLIREINNEISRAKEKWGKIDEDLHEMLNGVTEELLEVVHAVNHREGSAKVHEEIVQAIGVLVRLDEMADNMEV